MTTLTTNVTAAASAVVESIAPPPSKSAGKLRIICRHGGHIAPHPQTKSLYYLGGDTRIIAVPFAVAMSFLSLANHLASALGISYSFTIKYQLPNHDLDSLISVATDDDLQIMLEEHGRLSSESLHSQSRIRLFFFPAKPLMTRPGATQSDPAQQKPTADMDWFGIGETETTRGELTRPVLQHPKTETWFVDALRSARIMQSEGNSGGGSGDGGGGLCGHESIALETNSSFGSTSSSASSTNLSLIKSHDEDYMVNLQDNRAKFTSPESVASDNNVATPLSPVQTGSSNELATHLPVFDKKVPSNPFETETNLLNPSFLPQMNKPVFVSGYPPSAPVDHPQQQKVQFIYPGSHYITQKSPGMLPVTSYYPTHNPLPQQPTQVCFQPPQQPYMVCHAPVDQRHQTGLMGNLGISTGQPQASLGVPLKTSQVDSKVVRATNPLVHLPYEAPQQIHHQPQTTSVVAHRDTGNYNNGLEGDTARAQIYKSQPPPPLVPSQYQPVMLSEAFAKLRIDKT